MNLFFPSIISLLVTIYLIKLLSEIAPKINLIDVPTRRKLHGSETPVVGGIAIVLGLFVAALISPTSMSAWRPFFLSMLPLIVIGVIDDISGVKIYKRIIAQIISCLIMIQLAGIKIVTLGDFFGFGQIQLDFLSWIFTIFIFLALINSFNLIDGIDGLCGLTGLVSLIGILFIIKIDEASASIAIIIYFCVSLIGFLLINLGILKKYIKKVFLGDAGTTVLGFFICWQLIKLSQPNEGAIIRPIICLWLIALPVFDTLTVIILRIKSGKSPFSSDRSHIHYLLKRLKLSDTIILLILISFSIASAIIGIIGEANEVQDHIMLLSFVLLYVLYFGFNLKLYKKTEVVS